MYATQQPLSTTALQDVMDAPAWYIVATNDQAIPSDVEHLFAKRTGATTVELPSRRVAMVSPDDVAKLIETAVRHPGSGSDRTGTGPPMARSGSDPVDGPDATVVVVVVVVGEQSIV